MQLTFVNDLGQPTVIEIDPQMELENVMALLEAEVCLTRAILFPFLTLYLVQIVVRHSCRRAEYTL
jgi:hypothetical protein